MGERGLAVGSVGVGLIDAVESFDAVDVGFDEIDGPERAVPHERHGLRQGQLRQVAHVLQADDLAERLFGHDGTRRARHARHAREEGPGRGRGRHPRHTVQEPAPRDRAVQRRSVRHAPSSSVHAVKGAG